MKQLTLRALKVLTFTGLSLWLFFELVAPHIGNIHLFDALQYTWPD